MFLFESEDHIFNLVDSLTAAPNATGELSFKTHAGTVIRVLLPSSQEAAWLPRLPQRL